MDVSGHILESRYTRIRTGNSGQREHVSCLNNACSIVMLVKILLCLLEGIVFQLLGPGYVSVSGFP
jgi:hypothetical protein